MTRARLHRLLAGSPSGLRRALKRIPGTAWLRNRMYGLPGGPAPRPGDLRPVVYPPTWLSWEVMKQRPQYLLEAFAAAGHQVWFVDPRLDRVEEAGERIRLVPSLREVPPAGVILYTHFAPTRTQFDSFDDAVVVYDLLDDLKIYEAEEVGMAPERTVAHHHGPVMRRADVVIASNPVLVERHRAERDDVILVENGVDLDRFTLEGPVASELPPGRVVGFHGALAPWIDLDLIEALARARPGIEVVLVGPVDPKVERRAEALFRIDNVHWFPSQPSGRIAEFVRGFRVGILPFVVEEMTEAVTPLKMFEYLACGVPPVATPLPACVAHPAVRTAADPDGFLAAVDDSAGMGEGERAALRSHAEEAEWGRRVAPLLARLDRDGRRRVP